MKRRLGAIALAGMVFASTSPAFSVATSAVATGISGVVVGNQNQPLANVKISVTHNGALVLSAVTGSDGSYSLALPTNTYSMKFLPPTAENSTLYAYDIASPQSQSLRVMLTTPTPGRAFVAGNLSLSSGDQLARDTYVAFGNVGGDSQNINLNGDYRLTPTAGTSGTWHIKGDINSNGWQFELLGQTSATINQDELANIVVPMATQRVRILTPAGQPVVNASIQSGVGEFGLPNGVMTPIEGLGAFQGRWIFNSMTDAAGWTIMPMMVMSSATQGEVIVAPSATAGYGVQVFKPIFGNGDITLTLTNPVVTLGGTVKDSAGIGIDGTQVQFGNTYGVANSSGAYAMSQPVGTSGNYSLVYDGDGATHPNFAFQLTNLADTFTVAGAISQNFAIPTQVTKVRVTNEGQPVMGATVMVVVGGGNNKNGSLTLLSGHKALSAYVMGESITDQFGFAQIPLIRLDSAIPAMVAVTPTTAPGIAPFVSTQIVGAGADLTIAAPIPSVTISGHVAFSDGTTLITPYISFQDGKGNGAGIQADSSNNFSFSVSKGFAGMWGIGCRMQPTIHDPLCVSISNSSSLSYAANSTQNLTIPTYKTVIKIVDPSGNPISGVRINEVVGTTAPGNYPSGQINLIPGQPTFSVNMQSWATTDTTGLAQLPTVSFLTPEPAYITVTPPPTSRYVTRNVAVTVGDNSQNVIVLTILKPVINSITISNVGGIKTVSVIGDNLLGTLSVLVGKNVISKFTVVDVNHLTFPATAGLTVTGLAITNGGGTTTWGS
jgi:hypothetical protein